MVAHFIRQFFKGAITLLISSLLIYSLAHAALSQAWGSPVPAFVECFPNPCPPGLDEAIARTYQLDKPWPLNYLAWLFDREKPYLNQSARGIDITVAGLRIKGSGALTGDFGASLLIEKGVSVVEEFRGAGKLLAFTLGLINILMGVAIYQRRGRPPVYGMQALPTPYALAEKMLGPSTGYRQV